MENESGQEKKHDPGERQWKEAAEKGELARSTDLSAAAVLLTGGAALLLGTNLLRRPIAAFWTDVLATLPEHDLDRAAALAMLHDGFGAVLAALAVPLGLVLVAAVVVNLAQSGGRPATKALEPRFERLNVFKGMQQHYLSWTPLVELGKSLLKLGVLGGAVAWAIADDVRDLPRLATTTPAEQLKILGGIAWDMFVASIPVILVVAAADYAYSYWRTLQNLKRTDKELKDDNKEREGDPHFKQRRRQRAREIALGSMLLAAREADVVITNPTHYAVALRYRAGQDVAPMVVAKGADRVALALRREARDHDVPTVENRRLARALHADVQVGHPVPEELYSAVARVLAVVYRKRGAPV